MSVNFQDEKFRSKFQNEHKRILSAIQDSESLDQDLNLILDNLKSNIARTKGSASLIIRISEQIISNRNHRLSLIKELRFLKKDILDREIKLAERESDLIKDTKQSGLTPNLLKYLQKIILIPGSSDDLLEPDGIQNEEKNLILSDELTIGQLISDTKGDLWIVLEDRFESTGEQADLIDLEPNDGQQPYAILGDGRHVLVIQVEEELE
jgi:hypothetical protein